MTLLSLRSLIELVAVICGAVISLGTIAYAIYRGASSAFSKGVTDHVAPIFHELKVMLASLNDALSSVQEAQRTHVSDVNAQLHAHDTSLQTQGERLARLEGFHSHQHQL